MSTLIATDTDQRSPFIDILELTGFQKGLFLFRRITWPAKQFCFSLSSIAFIRLSIGSLKVNFWGQRANRLPAVAMFHIESRGRSRRVLKKCDRQGGHRTKGRKDEVGRGGLSSTPPRALVIFYPPHPNLSKKTNNNDCPSNVNFFLVRHFPLFKGNKASLIHNNFCVFFFWYRCIS